MTHLEVCSPCEADHYIKLGYELFLGMKDIVDQHVQGENRCTSQQSCPAGSASRRCPLQPTSGCKTKQDGDEHPQQVGHETVNI